MIAFICLFFPPVVLICLWDKFVVSLSSKKQWLLAYSSAVLGLNAAVFTIVGYVFNRKDSIISRLNSYQLFAAKYMLLSTALALLVLAVYVHVYVKKSIRLEVKRALNSRLVIPWRVLACLYAAVLFGLNVIRIFDSNFWADEVWTTVLTKMSIGELVVTTKEHPPLYYIIVRLFYLVFGEQGWMYHAVSLIPLAIILCLALTRIWKQFGGAPAVFLMTAASIAPNYVRYNVEVRMYSWAEVFVLLSFFGLYQILCKNRKASYFWFALWSVAAAYTHYYALIAVAFFYVVLLIWGFFKRENLPRILLTCMATVVAYLPWFVILLETFKKDSNDFWIKSVPTFKECIDYIFSSSLNNKMYGVLLISFVLATVYELGIISIEQGKKANGEGTGLRILIGDMHITSKLIWIFAGLLSVFGTIAVGIGVSKALRPLFHVRYTLPVSIVMWTLAGIVLARLKGGKLYIAAFLACILSVSIPTYQRVYTSDRRFDEATRQTVSATAELMDETDCILTDIYHVSWTMAGYYYPNIACELIDLEELPELDKTMRYWLIVERNKSEEELDLLKKQGFGYEQIVKKGCVGTTWVDIYAVEYESGSIETETAETEAVFPEEDI